MWKFPGARLIAATLLFFSATAPSFAETVFADTFESGLGAWTSKAPNRPTTGITVVDPFNPANHVLTFTGARSGGDIFSVGVFPASRTANSLTLSFDYLGTCGAQNCGGFFGLYSPVPGTERWLAGSDPAYPGLLAVLRDTGAWTHVSMTFAAASNYQLTLERFSGSPGSVNGRIYFDNISVSTVSAVPEPSSFYLLACGLIAIAFIRRYKSGTAPRSA